MLGFVHETLGQRVRFGTGTAREAVREEIGLRGAHRVLVVSGNRETGLTDDVAKGLADSIRFSEIVQHVPIASAERARKVASEFSADLIVCIGGGSTTGLAKAVALTTGIPIVAVPTTFAGSEATNVWGLTEASRKATGVDPRVLPSVVIYDAELTMSLPVDLAASSGLNALAHCVDSLWAPRTDPINQALAVEGIRALSSGLRGIVADPTAVGGYESALFGTYLSAVAFASSGSGMHHKICHVLGGTFNLPHAPTHAIVLPYVTAFNAEAVPVANARLAAAFGSLDGLSGLEALRTDLSAPRSLASIGLKESDIPHAAELCLAAIPRSNPRPFGLADVERILTAAWAGSPAVELSEKGNAP
ncbi:maleylacetate reductase [Lacisediminihabitans sp. H27-G8]